MDYPVPSKYSQAANLRAIVLERLEKNIPNYGALPIPIVRLLVDQILILESTKRTSFRGKTELIDLYDNNSEFQEEEALSVLVYRDYGFLVAPAYKAFEGFLLFIASEFSLPVEKYEHRIGGLYDWEANKEEREVILKALEEKLGDDKEGKDRWCELNMVLRNYRHNPAHYLGDKIKNFEQADDYTRTIINTINQMVKYLIEKRVIVSGIKDIETICKIN